MAETGYTVEITGLDELKEKLKKSPGVFGREIKIAMEQSVKEVEAGGKQFAPVDRGTLRVSIGSEVQDIAGGLKGIVGSSLSDEIYPTVMEFGAKPFHTSYQNLKGWVRRKIGPPEKVVAEVAWNISKKIEMYGIKGRFYMKQGLEAKLEAIRNHFREALRRVLEEIARR